MGAPAGALDLPEYIRAIEQAIPLDHPPNTLGSIFRTRSGMVEAETLRAVLRAEAVATEQHAEMVALLTEQNTLLRELVTGLTGKAPGKAKA